MNVFVYKAATFSRWHALIMITMFLIQTMTKGQQEVEQNRGRRSLFEETGMVKSKRIENEGAGESRSEL